VAADSDSQVPIFLDRLRTLFRSSTDEARPEEDPNWGAAVAVCILLSFVLWLSLTLQEQRTVTVEFPVEVASLPDSQALVELPPSSVSVQLRGTGLDLLGLVFSPSPIQVPADEGQVTVQEAVQLPRATDAQVESVSPQEIGLKLESRVERRVPVQPRLNIVPASTYELIDTPTISPGSVRVSGAQSVVGGLEAWPTDSLTLKQVEDTVRTRLALKDSLSGLVTRSADAVTVEVRAGKFAVETREVKVQVTGVPAGQDLVALQPSTIRIRYRVLFSQLFASRRSSEFFATVSYSQIRTDTTGYVEPRVHVPTDLVIRDPEPIPPRLRYYTFLSGG
jgi:hypothetical protein